MELIDEVIEQSRYKFDMRLAVICIKIIELMEKEHIIDNRCWNFMQLLFIESRNVPMNLPYYWYKKGVVVDPETLTEVTGGVIRFKWDNECEGCQIEHECMCEGNPNF